MVVNYVVPENDLQIITHGKYDFINNVSVYNQKKRLIEPVEKALIETKDINGK